MQKKLKYNKPIRLIEFINKNYGSQEIILYFFIDLS